jgi:membrane associated rhomboid family serine protease
MIPIRDTIRSTNFPAVNYAIIAVNCLVFLREMTYPGDLNQLIMMYGLVPVRFSVPEIAAQFTFSEQAISWLSFMFLHGSFLHLIGNMWFLYIFGDNIEDLLGSLRYLLFYLLCGWISGFAHVLTNLDSAMPTIGASGAIAGVMGAYLISFYKSRILTLIPILFIPYFVEIPSPFFLGIWVFFQVLSAAFTDSSTSGIAWWAHIGGFAAGMAILKVFLLIPESGLSRKIRKSTERQSSPRLHVARGVDRGEGADIYGTITLSPSEARLGTGKLITIKNGSQNRTVSVKIPPGTEANTILRLAGQGKKQGGQTGDFYLRVMVFPD